MKDLLVVDCQYDFIDGSLACGHSEEAVRNIIAFINANPDMKVFYSADNHSYNHCSYTHNGGTWPVHCQAGTHGAEIHRSFYSDVINPEQRPNENTIYYKGENDRLEEYSAFEAKNKAGKKICDVISDSVIVSGIASEFCVRESVIALLNSGRNIEIPENMLGWVDEANHHKNIDELRSMGVKVS
ncbi:MAG: isochorismatase family protein [Synergistaceae bacterium]|nr:isochorismatase family protein [Synergistaceae bacterium]MBQ9404519.1 isochorismatase family protein [Synergistaceae bacterium]MBQ9595708.1 isochorismatase family protein [Synergistaceae bacterium]MBR0203071.1 isochorismatase family protein [Synergistaceae bacterium]